jgi:hypothetical protein
LRNGLPFDLRRGTATLGVRRVGQFGDTPENQPICCHSDTGKTEVGGGKENKIKN